MTNLDTMDEAEIPLALNPSRKLMEHSLLRSSVSAFHNLAEQFMQLHFGWIRSIASSMTLIKEFLERKFLKYDFKYI